MLCRLHKGTRQPKTAANFVQKTNELRFLQSFQDRKHRKATEYVSWD